MAYILRDRPLAPIGLGLTIEKTGNVEWPYRNHWNFILSIHFNCKKTALSHQSSMICILTLKHNFKKFNYFFLVPSVLRANSAGLMEYWKKRNIMNIDMCMLDKKKAEGNPKPIKLIELSSAFFVLGVGIALSAFVFLIEKFVHFVRLFSSQLSIIEVWNFFSPWHGLSFYCISGFMSNKIC